MGDFEQLEKIKDETESYKKLIKRSQEEGISYFTPNFKRYIKSIDLDVCIRILQLETFFEKDETIQVVEDMNDNQKKAIDETLQYIQAKIHGYADDIDKIRKTISEKFLE